MEQGKYISRPNFLSSYNQYNNSHRAVSYIFITDFTIFITILDRFPPNRLKLLKSFCGGIPQDLLYSTRLSALLSSFKSTRQGKILISECLTFYNCS